MISHEEASELLGAYALHAVDGDEVTEVEEHLDTCPRCRAELDGLREVAGALGTSVEERLRLRFVCELFFWRLVAEEFRPSFFKSACESLPCAFVSLTKLRFDGILACVRAAPTTCF